MQLTLFTDYSVRTLIYLGMHCNGLISIGQVARAYRISENHLIKVAQLLAKLGLVEAVRGRGGGLRLALPPEHINIGRLIRQTEPNLDLAECFNDRTSRCPISSACKFKDALYDARNAFLTVLDNFSLADLLRNGHEKLPPLWNEIPADYPPVNACGSCPPGGARASRRPRRRSKRRP